MSSRPSNAQEALGACISYLSGTRDYREWQVCDDLKQKELPKLGLTDFRKAAARQLRDARLRGKCTISSDWTHLVSRDRPHLIS